MPTFTAIALERLLEHGASECVDKSVSSAKLQSKKPPKPKLDKRGGSESTRERKTSLPQISPALYSTPMAISLSDSPSDTPSSFPSSPYIINHKGRGRRHSKSFSVGDEPSSKKALNEEPAKGNEENAEIKAAKLRKATSVTVCTPQCIKDDVDGVCDTYSGSNNVNGSFDGPVVVGHPNGVQGGEIGSSSLEPDSSNKGPQSNDGNESLKEEHDLLRAVAVKSERESEAEDFYDPRDSMSFTSNSEVEDNAGAGTSLNFSMLTDFYDAREELSSDSGLTSVFGIESELREIRLSLLMEIEKRKQAEESLNHVWSYWIRVREQLALVGLTLPADPIALAEHAQSDIDLAEELYRQFHIARFVSESLGRGMAKAEVEMEMEAQLESKNFEIARLSDRLQYYEAVNHEMSQRNQEAVEMARRDKQRKQRRQRWVWGSIAAAITLGTAALAWSYLPSGKVSSSTNSSQDARPRMHPND